MQASIPSPLLEPLIGFLLSTLLFVFIEKDKGHFHTNNILLKTYYQDLQEHCIEYLILVHFQGMSLLGQERPYVF